MNILFPLFSESEIISPYILSFTKALVLELSDVLTHSNFTIVVCIGVLSHLLDHNK